MANLLRMALIETIFSLHQRGWSRRRIARELGIDRETVARHLLTPAPKPAIAPSGSEVAEEAASAEPGGACGGRPGAMADGPSPSPPGSADAGDVFARPSLCGRYSDCEAFRDVIAAKLSQELSAQRIYQDLVGEHGFAGSYYSVRRFTAKLQPSGALPVRRLECAPGEEAQVDFGMGAWLHPLDGKRRRTHVLRIVLSHSRKGYSEAVLRQTTDDFLRCLENAFWHFGGVPLRLLLDNLKAAVLQADWYDPELNPRFASFCQHYRIAPWPLRPRKPEHTGKVERGVGYVQDNALKGKEFATLAEQNPYLLEWEAGVADKRIHGTTRQQVGAHFAAVKRAALQPLPAGRFPNMLRFDSPR